MTAHPESYALGPAERLVPWLDPEHREDNASARTGASAAVLTTVWHDDQATRWTRLGTLAVTLMRHNKRVLLVAPTHDAVDRLLGFLAKTLRNAALPFHSLLSRLRGPGTQSKPKGFHSANWVSKRKCTSFSPSPGRIRIRFAAKYERFRETHPGLGLQRAKTA